MCCTRSPACVPALKSRPPSGLGEHCRYHAQLMPDSPYQAPNAMPKQHEPQHRSFRLTDEANSSTSLATETPRRAIASSIVQQVPLLLLTSLILDGGLIFNRFAIAAVAYWTIALIMLLRSQREMTATDLRLLKWGYLPLVLITCILWVGVGFALNI